MTSDDFQKEANSVQESDLVESGLDSSLNKNQLQGDPGATEAGEEVDRPLEAKSSSYSSFSLFLLLMGRR